MMILLNCSYFSTYRHDFVGSLTTPALSKKKAQNSSSISSCIH